MNKTTSLPVCSRNTSLKNLGVLLKSTCFSLLLLTTTQIRSQCGGIAKNGSIGSDLGTGPGVVAWLNPANAEISDNVRTSASTSVKPGTPQMTHYLNLRNFGFSIPGGASICGIVVAVEHRKNGGSGNPVVTDYSIQLTSGSYTSSNYAKLQSWSDSDEVFVYGSETDNWGVNWTPSDVNQSGFGINITAKISAGTSNTSLAAEIDNAYMILYTNAVLPVELTSFNAKRVLNKVDVDWATATETNNSFFVVERSKDAMNFTDIAHVKGAGTSLQAHSYAYTDAQPFSGVSYYRLKQVDMNGAEKVYPITQVYIESKWSVDPVSQPGTLLVRGPQNNVLTQVDLINFNGEKMWTLQSEKNDADQEIRIDVKNIPPGLYFVKAVAGSDQFCAKTLLIKE